MTARRIRFPQVEAPVAAVVMISLSLVAWVCLGDSDHCDAHPNSLSSSYLRVSGSSVEAVLRCQVLSMTEVFPHLDTDGDGLLSREELEGHHDEVLAYIVDHYRLRSGADAEGNGGVPLRAEPLSLTRVQGADDDSNPFRLWEWIVLEFRFHGESAIEDLTVECSLFADTSPDHTDVCTVVWPGGREDTQTLGAPRPRARFDGTGSGFLAFVNLGARHILGGWDHLAFIVALLLATRHLWALLGVITAFTVAHSVTLAVAALEVFDVSPYARLVELAIALSIAYVACDNMLRLKTGRSRWWEAFFFGLVHGLGFAGFLGESLSRESDRVVPLVGFNLGVELGQILVVAILVGLVRFVPQETEDEGKGRFLAPVWLRLGGSAIVAALGFFWFFQRL